MDAARDGSIEEITRLLSQGAHIDATDEVKIVRPLISIVGLDIGGLNVRAEAYLTG